MKRLFVLGFAFIPTFAFAGFSSGSGCFVVESSVAANAAQFSGDGTAGSALNLVSPLPIDDVSVTYGVVAATGAFSGAVDIAGQVTMGAAATKSTFTTTGNLSIPGTLILGSKTKSALGAYSPSVAGELWYCSDCSATNIAVSTGTGVGMVSDIHSKTTAIN